MHRQSRQNKLYNIMKNLFIFAVCLMGINATANADQPTTSIKSSNAQSANLLANGAEKEFVSYVETKQKNIASSSEWSDFVMVVTSYNQNPKEFLKLDDSKKTNFNVIALLVQSQLAKTKGDEAKKWAGDLKMTTGVINYLWNSGLNNIEVDADKQENVIDADVAL